MKKCVMITGGSSGIGAECVRLFAQNNFNVAFNYKMNKQDADTLTSSLLSKGYNVVSYQADICDYNSVKYMSEDFINNFGKIDILINNAGISQQKLFTEITPDDWKQMIDTNLTGVYNATHCFVKNMINNKSGCIINLSSIWGVSGGSCEVHYSAAKSGIIGFTKALAKELSLSGIRVNAVAPGIIDTRMNNHLSNDEIENFVEDLPLQRMGTPFEVAKLIYYLCSDDASYITGQTINIDGGFSV